MSTVLYDMFQNKSFSFARKGNSPFSLLASGYTIQGKGKERRHRDN